ncbi:hypothetical protein T484DRAFT_1783332, partial [Baffinella frigidus]
ALSETQAKNYEVMKEAAAAERNKHTLQGTIAELRVELEGMHARVSRHSDATTEAHLARERENSVKAQLQVRDTELREERTALSEATDRAREAVMLVRTRDQELLSVRSELENSARQLSDAQARLSDFQAQLGTLTGSNAQLNSTAAEARGAFETLAVDHQATQHREDELRRRDAQLSSVVRRLEEDNHRLEDQNELSSVVWRLEEDKHCLEDQNEVAAQQFAKLGEESARLLSACEVERDLRSKLEAALHIKERQVSSLMEMNARLSADAYAKHAAPSPAAVYAAPTPVLHNQRASSPQPFSHGDLYSSREALPTNYNTSSNNNTNTNTNNNAGGALAAASSGYARGASPPRTAARSQGGGGGDGQQQYLGARGASPPRTAARSMGAQASGGRAGRESPGLGASAGTVDRQRLMDEIETLMSSLQARSS